MTRSPNEAPQAAGVPRRDASRGWEARVSAFPVSRPVQSVEAPTYVRHRPALPRRHAKVAGAGPPRGKSRTRGGASRARAAALAPTARGRARPVGRWAHPLSPPAPRAAARQASGGEEGARSGRRGGGGRGLFTNMEGGGGGGRAAAIGTADPCDGSSPDAPTEGRETHEGRRLARDPERSNLLLLLLLLVSPDRA